MMSNTDQSIEPWLLELLVCPLDHSKLRLEGERLICTSCARVYPIEDGIPNLVVDGTPPQT